MWFRALTTVAARHPQPPHFQSIRGVAEIVNLSPSEVNRNDFSDRRPARYSFQKLEFNNNLLSQAAMKAKSKKMRQKSGLLLLEGRRLIQEAIDSGCEIESIFFSRTDDLNRLNLPTEQVKIYKTPYNEMKSWSDLTTPPGIIGVFRKPEPVAETRSSLPLTLICDQIREPGNLGSMIRNCAGVGVRRVILTSGCTDLWDGKVLRGGSGAHFKVRIREEVDWAEIEGLVQAENASLMVASSSNSNDASSDRSSPPAGPLQSYPYWSGDYTRRHNFLVVGGETEGLSLTALEVAARTDGARLHIPLANNVDSLNSVSAASVIMFEMKKQIVQFAQKRNSNT